MGYPRRFEKDFREYGYHMEVDVKKSDCNREPVHWHLCQRRDRIGQIWVSSGLWEELPDVGKKIREEAEELTRYYSDEITDTYLYNKVNGADD
jgi:hypothetical protein